MTINSVIIDSREPAWVQSLSFGGVPTAVVALDAGDFMVACSDNRLLIIERKTSDDLLGSIKDERIFKQCAALREQSEYAYLLITGALMPSADGRVITTRMTGWDWNAVQGALLDIQELGVCVVYSRGDDDLEQAIIRLSNRDRDDVDIQPRRTPNILGPGESAIAALPGIGMERLSAVMEATGRPFWALVALTDPQGEHIPGIGPGIKLIIRRALGFTDKYENLTLAPLPIGTVAEEIENDRN